MILSNSTNPQDVKALDRAELPVLCRELREAILNNSAAVGGHVAPNLGVVELTVALHRVFESPRDKIVFDVSHQTYVHKALTGRAAAFIDPDHYGEVSGFSNPDESEHDLFAVGHTSTSVSLGCGLARARDLAGESYDIVAVIGDGALSGGLAYEGLNNAAELPSGLIIVINDNEQSIAENHGGLYGNLARLRETNGTANDNFFRSLGLDYRYLEDGNDVLALVDAFEALRGVNRPTVLHVHTSKGCGFELAERDPEAWHHVGPFNAKTGEKLPAHRTSRGTGETYAELTGSYLEDAMQKDRGIVAVSAATPYIMGFNRARREAAGRQFVDVGIAEEHAVTCNTALAKAGCKPVFGVYGTFLQRAYDELWHDLCLNDAPATILVFGASIFGTSAETHLSFFDISMLGDLPNLRYLVPACREEYMAMLEWSLAYREHPVAIRVPGMGVVSRPDLAPAAGANFNAPEYQVVRRGSRVAVLALGDFFELGEQVADELANAYGIQATLVNPRFATELDTAFLDGLSVDHDAIITIEDGILEGGWGEKVARYLAPTGLRCQCFGISKGFPDRYKPEELLAQNGMTAENMAAVAKALLGE